MKKINITEKFYFEVTPNGAIVEIKVNEGTNIRMLSRVSTSEKDRIKSILISAKIKENEIDDAIKSLENLRIN